jgi:hypothetical protein
VLAVTCGVAQAHGGSPKDIAFIKNALHQIDLAAQAKDIDKYISYLTPNFQDIDEHGTVTSHSAAEERQRAVQLFKGTPDLKFNIHTTVKSIKFSGDEAVVTEGTNGTMSGTVNGKFLKARMVSVDKDTWVRSGSGWLEAKSRTISSKITPMR